MKYVSDLAARKVDAIILASRQLPAARTAMLAKAATQMVGAVTAQGQLNLLFVCTHNSRRSQFSQVWCTLAAAHYEAQRMQVFSCGTEATACNPRAVDSLRRFGLNLTIDSTTDNPIYVCEFSPGRSLELYSKAFGHPTLPTEAIFALLCCDDADRNCPVVPGASYRVPLHYRDPKASDGTADESRIYDERSSQIAAEMYFLVREFTKLSI